MLLLRIGLINVTFVVVCLDVLTASKYVHSCLTSDFIFYWYIFAVSSSLSLPIMSPCLQELCIVTLEDCGKKGAWRSGVLLKTLCDLNDKRKLGNALCISRCTCAVIQIRLCGGLNWGETDGAAGTQKMKPEFRMQVQNIWPDQSRNHLASCRKQAGDGTTLTENCGGKKLEAIWHGPLLSLRLFVLTVCGAEDRAWLARQERCCFGLSDKTWRSS